MVDFNRLNHIKHVIECDYDSRRRCEVESRAKCWQYAGVMASILKLPVATWDCPTSAVGEIDTERKTKMWNQGNGNGQGNGYGQGANDTYDRLNGYTRELGGARFPFMEDSGRYALAVLEEFQHTSDGPSARALFKVIECKGKHTVGSFVVKIWKLVKPPKYQNKPSDGELFTDFCRKLKGAPAGYPMGNDIRVLMKERPQDQLARGTVIDAVGVPNQKGTWVDIYWNTVQQSPQDIAAMRQRLEAAGIPDTGSRQGSQGAPPQQGYAQPVPQGYAQPPQQYGQPQPAPYNQGGPAPQQGWGQPQQAPAAPQGGYLANVPPQGNNGNGGNGTW